MAQRWRFFEKAIFAAHVGLYRLSGGRLGANHNGPILLLTTTGRKSGKSRTRPLVYMRDGDAYVLVASNGAKDMHPAWYWNLTASPRARAEVGRERFDVSAREASDEERAELWPRLVAQSPVWGEYVKTTDRKFPVMVLTRVD